MLGRYIMNANDITQIISSVGFPIVAAVAMFWLYDKTIRELTAIIQKVDATLDMIVRKLENDSL